MLKHIKEAIRPRDRDVELLRKVLAAFGDRMAHPGTKSFPQERIFRDHPTLLDGERAYVRMELLLERKEQLERGESAPIMKFAMTRYDGWGRPAWVLPMLRERKIHMTAKLQQLIRELGHPDFAAERLQEQQERGIVADPVTWGRPSAENDMPVPTMGRQPGGWNIQRPSWAQREVPPAPAYIPNRERNEN